jgi:MFS family permease
LLKQGRQEIFIRTYSSVNSTLRPEWLNSSLAWLFVVRALRSASQGFLVIIIPLYLALLRYDAVHIGIVFTAAAVASAVLSALVGVLSDRFGRKTFLILISLLSAGGGIVFALSQNFTALLLAAAIGTIGRGGGAGSGGNWGPFYPAEQALIAEHSSDLARTTVFGALSFVGVVAGALGSLLAWLPRLLEMGAGLPVLDGYRVLFVLTAVFGFAMALAVVPVRETPHHGPARTIHSSAPRRSMLFGLSRPSWALIVPLMITNAVLGLAVGMLGPIVVYWFYRAYGVDAGELANLFFAINLAAAVPYLLAGRIAFFVGSVRTVALARLAGAGFLFAMIFAPNYSVAALLYAIQIVIVTLAVPVAQSYLMGIIVAAERASAAGISTVPWQTASSAGPYLAGYLMQYAALDLPIEMSAGLGALGAILYYWFFRDIRPPEELMQSRDDQAGAALTESAS